jgi:beta-lactamase class A
MVTPEAQQAETLEWLENLEGVFSGQIAVAAHLRPGSDSLVFNGERVQRTASTVKLAILIETLRQVEKGTLAYAGRVQVPDDPKVICGGSGVLKDLDPGISPTIRDLCTLMVVLSDNTATNLLIDLVGGVGAVNKTMDEFGMPSIRLHIRAEIDLIDGDIKRFAEGTAGDLAKMMVHAVEGTLVSAWVSNEVLRLMRRQQYLDQVPRYFQWNPYAEEFGLAAEQISVASKTGFFPGVRSDVGVISLPNGSQIAYAVLTEDGDDHSHNVENEGSIIVGMIGKRLLEHWWPADHGVPPTGESAATRLYDQRLEAEAGGVARP